MIRGASAAACDWGDYWVKDNFDHLSTVGFGLRRLGRFASLRGRIRIEGSRHATAMPLPCRA